jgi:AraC-like DNA-binding protein
MRAAGQLSSTQGNPLALREESFWGGAGAAWRRLGGSFSQEGFSFEWHEWESDRPLDWAGSFHANSIEVCLNLEGRGHVSDGGNRIDFTPETVGFFLMNGRPLSAARAGGERHRFLSIEFSLAFLKSRLGGAKDQLHPLVRHSLEKRAAGTMLSTLELLTHRQRDLMRSLLQPPVLAAAQKLWYESKALEFASELFFSAEGTEPLCSRARRLALERVARAKAVLLSDLSQPWSLEELGKKVGCSPFYLSRTFSQETGLTLSQWLRRARLERAAELLRSGQHNVTEAALEVGYSSLSHFSQAFHEQFGCCPGLYPVRTPSQQGAFS